MCKTCNCGNPATFDNGLCEPCDEKAFYARTPLAREDESELQNFTRYNDFGAEPDWNDTSNPAVRQAEADEHYEMNVDLDTDEDY